MTIKNWPSLFHAFLRPISDLYNRFSERERVSPHFCAADRSSWQKCRSRSAASSASQLSSSVSRLHVREALGQLVKQVCVCAAMMSCSVSSTRKSRGGRVLMSPNCTDASGGNGVAALGFAAKFAIA
jgi:hypothetical protein